MAVYGRSPGGASHPGLRAWASHATLHRVSEGSGLHRARGFAPDPALFEAMVAGVPDAIFVKDRRRRYVLVNDAFLALAGITAEHILDATDRDILDAELEARYRSSDERVLEHGESVRFEDDYVDPSGSTHLLATTKVPLRDASGAITHLLGVTRDQTRAKAAEERLRLANEELERRVAERTEALRGAQQALLRKERLAVLGQLAGGLAHQIRNPLAAISNGASVLKRRLGDAIDEDVQAALAVILEEVWEANRIITELLDYSRIRPPSPSAVEVAPLVEAALELAKPPASLQVDKTVEPGIVAWVDERQMRDALANVLRNACEAMPSGGRLVIDAVAEGPEIRVAVEDTGPGITRESLAYLFEPLVTTKPLGLGLGLATAKGLIENQGGTIRVSTVSAGRGARFEVRVPRPPE